MTRISLSALFVTIWFTGLVPGDVSLPNLGILSVWQIPEITAKEGTNVIITCHIKADSHVERIMVKWCQDNQTVPNSTTPYQRSPVNGSVRINATLHLLSVHLNHSGIYYCTAQVDLPTLGPVEFGNGTHVYVVPNSTVTTQTLTMNTVMWSVLSGLGFVLLIICIVCVIHIHYKGHCRIEPRAKESLVDVTRGSPCPDAHQTHVVYAALNIPQDSVKSRKENCPAKALTSVTCTEDSVTYSEVHLKKGPKDEG